MGTATLGAAARFSPITQFVEQVLVLSTTASPLASAFRLLSALVRVSPGQACNLL